MLSAILLSIMTLDMEGKTPPGDNAGRVRKYAAWGSVIFVATFLLCLGLGLVLDFHQGAIVRAWDLHERDRGRGWKKRFIRWGSSLSSILFQLLLVLGTGFLFAVMTEYVPAAGWFGVGLSAVMGGVAVVVWVLQTFCTR